MSGVVEIAAAVLDAPGAPFSIEQLVMDPPGPGQARVKLHACGVCHTDAVMRQGAIPVPFPAILGHEGAGVIEAIGPDAGPFQPGDHVLLSFASCGHCHACSNHQPGYCDAFFALNFGLGPQDGAPGIRRNGEPISARVFGQSAFASHALVDIRNMVRIDKELPLATLAPLGCGVQTGAGTVLETLQVQPGQSLAVLGAGAVGLSAVMAGKIAGAQRIALLDCHAHRLEVGQELGATEIAADIAALAGPFDHIVDTTGAVALLEPAFDRLAGRGTLALVGAYPPGAAFSVSPSAIMSGGRRIIGVVEGGIDPSLFLPALVEHYRMGRLPLEKIIRFYPFEAAEEAMQASDSGEVIKPVLVMEA
ncbi:NAD(P)-dependent alcohol dehydrogenase [Novosphingobium mathurense]|uniref:Aryl-alcohol dehydrogenase n=1 Tax=Novosphingobium mathurense TaxID=428990 RepID=A0A1U6IQR3_9SPHN|nr:NAD(P)-dependent alcohol dehydrogenase [Novosphingobium mathurense]SLK10353.1 aryl-alcohol dehydrogenase [Novosphingobium mathurense]